MFSVFSIQMRLVFSGARKDSYVVVSRNMLDDVH